MLLMTYNLKMLFVYLWGKTKVIFTVILCFEIGAEFTPSLWRQDATKQWRHCTFVLCTFHRMFSYFFQLLKNIKYRMFYVYI